MVDARGWGGGRGWRVVREFCLRHGLVVMMFCKPGCYRRIDLDTVIYNRPNTHALFTGHARHTCYLQLYTKKRDRNY